MAPQRSVDRDTGVRRISTTTRWLAGIGAGLVAALSLFFAGRAPSGTGATPPVSEPATAAPATAPPTTVVGSAATVQTTPPVTAPPVTYAPSRHTTSRGS